MYLLRGLGGVISTAPTRSLVCDTGGISANMRWFARDSKVSFDWRVIESCIRVARPRHAGPAEAGSWLRLIDVGKEIVRPAERSSRATPSV